MRWAGLKRFSSVLQIEHRAQLPLTLDDEPAFHAYAAMLTARNVRGAVLFILAATLLSWAIDPIVFRGQPDLVPHLSWVRAVHASSSIASYLVMRLSSVARRPMLVAYPVAILDLGVLGVLAGLLGSLDTPWFHCFYTVVFAGLFVEVGLLRRAVFTAVLSASLVGGFAVAHPTHLRQPMLLPTLAFLGAVTVGAVVSGHVVYLLIFRDFLQTREKRRARLMLSELNATLEQRVRDQTRELRLLADHLERAREDERTRISRELHDELGQEMTSMRYAMTLLKQRYGRDPASARGLIEQLDALIARTTTATRQIVTELRPRVLDDLGLDAAVEWLLKRTEQRIGVASHLTISGLCSDLDAEISVAAFRILQEALTNVARHARATRIDVDVAVERDLLRLSVRDDGVGMSAPDARTPPSPGRGGMGLIGMRERSEALGGQLSIESRPGGGTTLRALLPVTRVRLPVPPEVSA